jgi:peptide-methionine (S)-S-oxide reductase
MAFAAFGAGCFWGVEAAFRKLDGVIDTAVGYMGGNADNPTYEEVCSDRTGHAEVVRVEYDPNRLSYYGLLKLFWEIHDPTTRNRQGPDIGSQYRSVIFYYDEKQQAAAESSRAALEKEGYYQRPIVTEITPAGAFWRAEEYHQRYLERRNLRGCRI